jgi:hypothetical protein
MGMDSDPGAGDAAAANGMISLSFGKLFEKVNKPTPSFSTLDGLTRNRA